MKLISFKFHIHIALLQFGISFHKINFHKMISSNTPISLYSDLNVEKSKDKLEILDEDEVLSRLGSAAIGLEDSFAFGNKVPTLPIVITYENKNSKTNNTLYINTNETIIFPFNCSTGKHK